MDVILDITPIGSAASVMGLLAQGVSLSLLMDLACGPHSRELLEYERAVVADDLARHAVRLAAGREQRA